MKMSNFIMICWKSKVYHRDYKNYYGISEKTFLKFCYKDYSSVILIEIMLGNKRALKNNYDLHQYVHYDLDLFFIPLFAINRCPVSLLRSVREQ